MKSKDILKTRIVSGGLSLALVASGYGIGRLNNNNNNSNDQYDINKEEIVDEYLDDYIKKRDKLEKEIDSLLNKEETLKHSEEFNISDLIVIENANIGNENNLYILSTTSINGICDEYHHLFRAWYNLHPEDEEHKFDFCIEYIHFYEYQPLVNYLTEEELIDLANNNGVITTIELDQILERIRLEYQEQQNYSNNLTNN